MNLNANIFGLCIFKRSHEASQNLWRIVRAKILNNRYFSWISAAVKHFHPSSSSISCYGVVSWLAGDHNFHQMFLRQSKSNIYMLYYYSWCIVTTRGKTSTYVLPRKVTCIQYKKSFSVTLHISLCRFSPSNPFIKICHIVFVDRKYLGCLKWKKKIFSFGCYLSILLYKYTLALWSNLQKNWKWYKQCLFVFLIFITHLEHFNTRNCSSLK